MLKQLLALCLSIVLFSACSDNTTADDWVGTYSGTLTFTEVMVSDGSVFTDSGVETLVIAKGSSDDQVLFSLEGGIGQALTIDGNKLDISNSMGSDYTDGEGFLTLDGDVITLEWSGTYLMDGNPYSEDTYDGTFTRQ